MSGIISYAKIEAGKKEAIIINKRKDQSDRAFIKQCKKYLHLQKRESLFKREIVKGGLAKNEVKYFDKAEADVTTKVEYAYA